MTPTLPVPATTLSCNFCSSRSPEKRPSASTSPSTHSIFSPFPSLQNGHPHFVPSPLSATPAKQGLLDRSRHQLALPRSPILWVSHATAHHEWGLQVAGGSCSHPSLLCLPGSGRPSTAKEKHVPEAMTQPAAQRSYSQRRMGGCRLFGSVGLLL